MILSVLFLKKYIFSRRRIVDWQFQHFKGIVYPLQPCIVSDKTLAVIFIFVPLYIMFLFSLSVFRVCWISVVFIKFGNVSHYLLKVFIHFSPLSKTPTISIWCYLKLSFIMYSSLLIFYTVMPILQLIPYKLFFHFRHFHF